MKGLCLKCGLYKDMEETDLNNGFYKVESYCKECFYKLNKDVQK